MKINGKKEIKFLDVDEGTKFTLNCSVDSGKPSGTIEWKRNDQHLLFGVHHVSFTFIPKESDNSDNYTCTAQNPATDYPLTKTVQLFVNRKLFQMLFGHFLSSNYSKHYSFKHY